jgi:hypothetical protein
MSKTPEQRIQSALEVAIQYGGIDGAHHKSWVIDQMVRALTDCPMVEATATDARGNPYTFEAQCESEEYLKLVAEANDGEDGPDTYEWNTGIAP